MRCAAPRKTRSECDYRDIAARGYDKALDIVRVTSEYGGFLIEGSHDDSRVDKIRSPGFA
jgi:hypothetical protein